MQVTSTSISSVLVCGECGVCALEKLRTVHAFSFYNRAIEGSRGSVGTGNYRFMWDCQAELCVSTAREGQSTWSIWSNWGVWLVRVYRHEVSTENSGHLC